jgi:hypothetical protein
MPSNYADSCCLIAAARSAVFCKFRPFISNAYYTMRFRPRLLRYIRMYCCMPVDFMVRLPPLSGAPRGKEHWRAPLEEEKAALDLFCATNHVGFMSFERRGFLPTKDYCGPTWSLYSEVQRTGYVVNVRNSGRSTDENENRQDSAPLFISNKYYTCHSRWLYTKTGRVTGRVTGRRMDAVNDGARWCTRRCMWSSSEPQRPSSRPARTTVTRTRNRVGFANICNQLVYYIPIGK